MRFRAVGRPASRDGLLVGEQGKPLPGALAYAHSASGEVLPRVLLDPAERVGLDLAPKQVFLLAGADGKNVTPWKASVKVHNLLPAEVAQDLGHNPVAGSAFGDSLARRHLAIKDGALHRLSLPHR